MTRSTTVGDTLRYQTYRRLGEAMSHMPGPLAHSVARGVARVIAWRGGEALDMNQRHMRRVLASECPEGVEPDADLVRRWSRRSFGAYASYWADGARLPSVDPKDVRSRFRLEEGAERLKAAMALGRGIVMALPLHEFKLTQQ